MELKLKLGRPDPAPPAEMSGDSLIIDCRGCPLVPMPGSDECIRCMVARMSEAGGADRVVLRTGLDTEISGRAGRVLKEVASLRRWSLPADRPRGRCRGCPVSRSAVMAGVWDSFPECGVDGKVAELAGDVQDRDACRECVASTARALRQLGDELAEVEAGMSGPRRPGS